ncbi:MAG: DUF4145 domain-containing protein [Candidatus Hecatellales archaeon]|nr:MAG: DUF4145 domain-containing protein [Candidatus Hecatellales archaeon]
MLAVVSVRVKRELKEEAEKLKINFRDLVERALEEEIWKRKAELLKSKVDLALQAMENLTVEDWVEALREARRER